MSSMGFKESVIIPLSMFKKCNYTEKNMTGGNLASKILGTTNVNINKHPMIKIQEKILNKRLLGEPKIPLLTTYIDSERDKLSPFNYSNKLSIENILKAISPIESENVKRILKEIEKRGFSWNARGQIIYENTFLQNSDITKIMQYISNSARFKKAPAHSNDILRWLQNINIPKEWVKIWNIEEIEPLPIKKEYVKKRKPIYNIGKITPMKNRLRKRKQKKNKYEHRYPERDYEVGGNLKDDKADTSMESNPFDERKNVDESDIDMWDLGAVGGKELEPTESEHSNESNEDDDDDSNISQQRFDVEINTKFDVDIKTLISKQREYLSELNDYLRIKIQNNETFLNKEKTKLPNDPILIRKLLPAITNLRKTILADMKSNRELIQYTLENTSEDLMKLDETSSNKNKNFLKKKYQNLENDLYELLAQERIVKSIEFNDTTSLIRDKIIGIQTKLAEKTNSLDEELKRSRQRNYKKITAIETEILKLISQKEALQKEIGDEILYKSPILKSPISKIPKPRKSLALKKSAPKTPSKAKKTTKTRYGPYVGT